MVEREIKARRLLADPDVKRWFDDTKRGSENTAYVYLNYLYRWLDRLKMSPQELIAKAKDDFLGLRDQISDGINDMVNIDTLSGNYIGVTLAVVSSFLKHRGVEGRFGLKITGQGKAMSVRKEVVPDKAMLAKILRLATPRARVSISLLAFSGLRPESIGSATDGLRLSDLPEYDIETNSFKTVPTKIEIRSELSKKDNDYFTFLLAEGVDYLKAYFQIRIDSGEELTGNSPVVRSNKFKNSNRNGFVDTDLIWQEVKTSFRKADFKALYSNNNKIARPYILRRYFAVGLNSAEFKGLISPPIRAFFMGHKGDIESLYATNKGLTEEQISEMREAYTRSQPYLQTEENQVSIEKLEGASKIAVLKMFGYEEKELQKMDVAGATNEELSSLIKDRMMNAFKKEFLSKLLNEVVDEELLQRPKLDKKIISKRKNGARQIAVNANLVNLYLDAGFEWVGTVGDQAIMRLP